MKKGEIKVRKIGKKTIKVSYQDKVLTFQLKIKRSLVVLNKLLSNYPNYLDIHELDDLLGDPNRALSDLRLGDGFDNFIDIKRNKKRNIEIALDLKKIFDTFEKHKESDIIVLSKGIRETPSDALKIKLKEKFSSKCNITGVQLIETIPGRSFLKNFQLLRYDHREPVAKGGKLDSENEENWQLLSELVNREKNNLCNICKTPKCIECALAYPEKKKKIYPTEQDISDLINLY